MAGPSSDIRQEDQQQTQAQSVESSDNSWWCRNDEKEGITPWGIVCVGEKKEINHCHCQPFNTHTPSPMQSVHFLACHETEHESTPLLCAIHVSYMLCTSGHLLTAPNIHFHLGEAYVNKIQSHISYTCEWRRPCMIYMHDFQCILSILNHSFQIYSWIK